MSLPVIYIIQASDAPQHTGRLKQILQDFKVDKRIDHFEILGADDDLAFLYDKMKKDDLILIVLSDQLEENKEQIRKRCKNLKSGKPGIRIAEILVDNVAYDNEFITLPTDLKPIRTREDMDSVWSGIDGSLGKLFPVKETEKESNGPDPSGDWWKYLKIAGIVIGLVLVFFIIRGLVNGNNGATDVGPDDPPPGQDTDQPEPGPATTSLTDRPPIPLSEREGTIIFGNYSNRNMDPRCTVTDVSARLLNAGGSIEVIEDAVGTNNLHVGVEYIADREMARVEITWEVEHPSAVECTVR